MASENNVRLQRALAPALKAAGYRKKGATWRKTTSESILVFNLQGSQWGPSFYVNLGVYFRALGAAENPADYDCHLRARLDSVVADREGLAELLDFERKIVEPRRFSELEQMVVEEALPWLERLSTQEGAREYLLTRPKVGGLVTQAVQEWLNVPVTDG